MMSHRIISVCLFLVLFSCKEDAAVPVETTDPCETVTDKAYAEESGLVVIEPEQHPQAHNWLSKSTTDGYLGEGYLVWEGDSYMNSPGNQTLRFSINIETTGTYRFIWRSRITKGTNGTEHNDSWLRFADADDFYGLKNDHVVYPGGSGKTPNPNGTSKDGWFKVYMNGAGEWKWQARTSDNDAHDIFIKFNKPGIFTMEIAARSAFHAIDRIVLAHESVNLSEATLASQAVSNLACGL